MSLGKTISPQRVRNGERRKKKDWRKGIKNKKERHTYIQTDRQTDSYKRVFCNNTKSLANKND